MRRKRGPRSKAGALVGWESLVPEYTVQPLHTFPPAVDLDPVLPRQGVPRNPSPEAKSIVPG